MTPHEEISHLSESLEVKIRGTVKVLIDLPWWKSKKAIRARLHALREVKSEIERITYDD